MSKLDGTLGLVTSRVLEELCFHFVEGEGSSLDPLERACATVSFKGPWSGRLFVGVERALLAELATNLLGDEEASEGDAAQALLELTNVICGNALPEIDSVEAAFELGSPELGSSSLMPEAADAYAAVDLDAGKVVVRITKDLAS